MHLCPLGNVGAAGLLLPSWWVTRSTAPQAVAALTLFPSEAADSVHGLAQTVDTKEASPRALGSVDPLVGWIRAGLFPVPSLPSPEVV